MNRYMRVIFAGLLLFMSTAVVLSAQKAGDAALGSRKYGEFEKPKFCGTSCHVDYYRQLEQEMHSMAYTHEWDEIEYFKLAVPQADKDTMVAGVKAEKAGMREGWQWRLPPKMAKTPEDGQGEKLYTFGKLGHLREPAGAPAQTGDADSEVF